MTRRISEVAGQMLPRLAQLALRLHEPAFEIGGDSCAMAAIRAHRIFVAGRGEAENFTLRWRSAQWLSDLRWAPSPACRLLRPRRQRPRRCAAKKRDELATGHSITSSARARSDGGMARPNVLAVWWLITNSNLMACMTGRSRASRP